MRKREEEARESSGIQQEGKREAIVSGTHTGVGLDSFIGRATPRSETARVEGREEGSGIFEERTMRREREKKRRR